MDFSKAEILTLIEVYRSKSVLWDPKNCDYFNKLKKEDAWEELSAEIEKPKAICKKKIEYLLAGLRREKLKIKRSVGTGKGTQEVYKSQWFAFESMQFLWDKNKSRRTLSTMEDEVQIVSPEAVEDEVTEQSYMGQNVEMLGGSCTVLILFLVSSLLNPFITRRGHRLLPLLLSLDWYYLCTMQIRYLHAD
uniref:uncharacterized protein LOC117609875 n=1 Tax=Osmia lignaria TaxID=473952 RepID=UPI001479399F|nr:uncharacterized protein LOC117609875 [Osmia lignaria]